MNEIERLQQKDGTYGGSSVGFYHHEVQPMPGTVTEKDEAQP